MRRHLAAVASVASLATMATTAPQHHHRRPRMAHAVLIPPVMYVADPTTTTTEAPSTTTTSVPRTTTTIRVSRGTPRTRQSPPTTDPAMAPPINPPELVGAPVPEHTVAASWYGPGFYGHGTACGQVMSTTLEGVAHRTLPCGTMVTLVYAGRQVTVPVVDRGPYVKDRHGNYTRTFDLTAATCRTLAHCFTGPIGWAA